MQRQYWVPSMLLIKRVEDMKLQLEIFALETN